MKKLLSPVSAALAISLVLAWAQPAWSNKLVAAGTPVAVAKKAMHVTPPQEWNRLSLKIGKNAEIWTLEGEQLDSLTFIGGIGNAAVLFREVDKKRRPLPKFNSTMLLTDLPGLLESSYRVTKNTVLFTVTAAEPVKFANNAGIRFTYDFIGEDEVRRQGEAYATIAKGKLYLVTYEGPKIHFFGQNIAAFRQLVATATIAS